MSHPDQPASGNAWRSVKATWNLPDCNGVTTEDLRRGTHGPVIRQDRWFLRVAGHPLDRLSQDRIDNLAVLTIQQTSDASRSTERQLFMTQSEQIHQRRMIVKMIDNV
jgi:hypothetical protein